MDGSTTAKRIGGEFLMAASPVVLSRNISNTDTVVNETYYVDDHFPSTETLGWSNDGFIFKEWNSSRDGTGIAKNVGDTITENWPSTWYVIWKSASQTIDYLVTNTELTDIADAIRIKAEISGSLIFPNGFISAINNIPSGGGSSLVSVQYVSATGTDKMIYVDSSGVFHDESMQMIDPDSGITGFIGQLPANSLFIVYFTMGAFSGTPTNMTLKKTIAISGRGVNITQIDFYEVVAP